MKAAKRGGIHAAGLSRQEGKAMFNSVFDRRREWKRLARSGEGLASARGAATSSTGDWYISAVLFGIIGGLGALWVFDLSLLGGALAAMTSAVVGLLFANG